MVGLAVRLKIRDQHVIHRLEVERRVAEDHEKAPFEAGILPRLDDVPNQARDSLDLYELTAVEREELDIPSMPHDLYEAVQVAEHSEFLKEALGAHVHKKLIETKLSDIDKFRLHVSEFDLQEHLRL